MCHLRIVILNLLPSKLTTVHSVSTGICSHPSDISSIVTKFETEEKSEILNRLNGYITTDSIVKYSSIEGIYVLQRKRIHKDDTVNTKVG